MTLFNTQNNMHWGVSDSTSSRQSIFLKYFNVPCFASRLSGLKITRGGERVANTLSATLRPPKPRRGIWKYGVVKMIKTAQKLTWPNFSILHSKFFFAQFSCAGALFTKELSFVSTLQQGHFPLLATQSTSLFSNGYVRFWTRGHLLP